MNHDYEDGRGGSPERRSRRNPKMRGLADSEAARESLRREKELWEERKRASAARRRELDVMGDATVRPLKRVERKTEPLKEEMRRNAAGERADRNASRAAAARQAAAGDAKISRGSGSVPVGAGKASLGGGLPSWEQELQNRKKRKRRRLITMIVAECFALLFIFGYGYVARRLNQIQRPENFKIEELKSNDLAQETVEKMKGYWTIAIFGVDARDNAITKGTNADVNIVCNINRDTGEIRLVSVFRDTYLNLSEGGSYNKLNQAYFVGGPEQAIQALNRNLDLNITDYMTFNWKAVADAINVLGGVDIELSKAEFYYINGFITETVKATGVGSHQLTHAGMNHLDGVQAVAYGRLRLMDTDFARTERQRKIIAQAFEKAKKADFKTLNQLIGTVFPQVSTSIWVDDLVSNAKNISKFHLGETSGFPQARGDVSMGKKGAVVVPQTLETNVVKLHEFLFGDASYAPSETVKKISAKIAADTGMYKEGNYVDKVGTGGGVIQAPKATKPAKTEGDKTDKEDADESKKGSSKAETDENGDPIESETDEDGNPVKRPTRPTESETDEDGNLVEPETDENGRPIKHPTRPAETETDEDGNLLESNPVRHPTKPTVAETDENGDPVKRPTEAETDEDGNPTGTTGHLRPGETTGSGSLRPTGSENESGTSRPGYPSESPGTGSSTKPTAGSGTGGTSQTPGGSTAPTRPTAGSSETTGAVKPTAGAGTGAVDRPGGSTTGGTTRPGGNTTGGTTVTRPGGTGTDTSGSTRPTSGNNTGIGSAGPDGSTGTSTIPKPPSSPNGPGGSGTGSSSTGSTGIVGGPGM